MEPEYLSLEPVKGFNTAQATQSPNLPSRSTHSSCIFLLSAPARAGDVGAPGTSTQWLRVQPAVRPAFEAQTTLLIARNR